MTPLADKLMARIGRDGPLRLDQFMQACLTDPDHGYYIHNHPIGAAGDFTTAPEMSQLFGEMIGLWLAQIWMDMGSPAQIMLAELGPGRGTMMADILRIARQVPGFSDALDVHLLEVSPTLRRQQIDTIKEHEITHIDDIAALADGPVLWIANEFFDALPVRQFQRIGDVWMERVVKLDAGQMVIGLAPLQGAPCDLPLLPDGAIHEVSGPVMEIAKSLGARIQTHGGAALIIDYGAKDGSGDTLQAVRGHGGEDILAAPGLADLSAHVRFADIARAGAPAQASDVIEQGVLLERLGITARANQLCTNATQDQIEAITAGHRRLTHPDEMGRLFKAMALVPSPTKAIPGFEP